MLFNLRTDPDELSNALERHPPRVRRFKRALEQVMDENGRARAMYGDPTIKAEIAPATRDRLEALGYIER